MTTQPNDESKVSDLKFSDFQKYNNQVKLNTVELWVTENIMQYIVALTNLSVLQISRLTQITGYIHQVFVNAEEDARKKNIKKNT